MSRQVRELFSSSPVGFGRNALLQICVSVGMSLGDADRLIEEAARDLQWQHGSCIDAMEFLEWLYSTTCRNSVVTTPRHEWPSGKSFDDIMSHLHAKQAYAQEMPLEISNACGRHRALAPANEANANDSDVTAAIPPMWPLDLSASEMPLSPAAHRCGHAGADGLVAWPCRGETTLVLTEAHSAFDVGGPGADDGRWEEEFASNGEMLPHVPIAEETVAATATEITALSEEPAVGAHHAVEQLVEATLAYYNPALDSCLGTQQMNYELDSNGRRTPSGPQDAPPCEEGRINADHAVDTEDLVQSEVPTIVMRTETAQATVSHDVECDRDVRVYAGDSEFELTSKCRALDSKLSTRNSLQPQAQVSNEIVWADEKPPEVAVEPTLLAAMDSKLPVEALTTVFTPGMLVKVVNLRNAEHCHFNGQVGEVEFYDAEYDVWVVQLHGESKSLRAQNMVIVAGSPSANEQGMDAMEVSIAPQMESSPVKFSEAPELQVHPPGVGVEQPDVHIAGTHDASTIPDSSRISALPLQEGMQVTVRGLEQKPEFNGMVGELEFWYAKKQTWCVNFPTGGKKLLKAKNLRPMLPSTARIQGKPLRCVEVETQQIDQHMGHDSQGHLVDEVGNFAADAVLVAAASSCTSQFGQKSATLSQDIPEVAARGIMYAKLQKLSSTPDLNGRRVKLLHYFDDQALWLIRLEDGKHFRVKPDNLYDPECVEEDDDLRFRDYGCQVAGWQQSQDHQGVY